MTTTVNEFMRQKLALEIQIASAKRAEMSTAISKARNLVSEFGLTEEDIFGASNKRSARAVRSRNGSSSDQA